MHLTDKTQTLAESALLCLAAMKIKNKTKTDPLESWHYLKIIIIHLVEPKILLGNPVYFSEFTVYTHHAFPPLLNL